MADPEAPLRVPAREIPLPDSLSPEARATLSAGLLGGAAYPEAGDLDGWRKYIAERDQAMHAVLVPNADSIQARVEERDCDGARVYAITPEGVGSDDRRVYLDIHGGALIMGGGPLCRAMGTVTAASRGAHTWSVDYRMPPDHPYPTPLDDCLSAYRALLELRRPEEIVVGGGSAGGNLAAALVLRARDEGLPLPAAAVLLTPELDLTESGDSFRTNLGVDTVLTGSLMQANLLYANGHDLAHPYLSPLFGDFAKGFPPTFVSAGTRDLFLSNAVRMHRALRAVGVAAELHVQEAAPHGGFFGTAPEDHEIEREVRRFAEEHWTG